MQPTNRLFQLGIKKIVHLSIFDTCTIEGEVFDLEKMFGGEEGGEFFDYEILVRHESVLLSKCQDTCQ